MLDFRLRGSVKGAPCGICDIPQASSYLATPILSGPAINGVNNGRAHLFRFHRGCV